MNNIIAGVDISKKKFDVCLLEPNGDSLNRVFSNDAKGFEGFVNWLEQKKAGLCSAAMEATGRYGEDLARFLHGKGYKVFIMNPAQIKYFGKSKLSRAKTDKKDSRLIAEFALKHPNLRLWVPLPPSQAKLRELYRCLEKLKEDRVHLLNRLENARDPDVCEIYNRQLILIHDQIEEIEKKIRRHIKADTDLNKKTELLQTIPGVGETVSWGILSEAPDIKNFNNARQLVGFVGLNPSVHESGSSVRGRRGISKMGSSSLRKLLYFPGMSAMRFNPVVKGFAQTLRAKGKKGKVIVVACMRKLVHIIYGVLSKEQPFCAG